MNEETQLSLGTALLSGLESDIIPRASGRMVTTCPLVIIWCQSVNNKDDNNTEKRIVMSECVWMSLDISPCESWALLAPVAEALSVWRWWLRLDWERLYGELVRERERGWHLWPGDQGERGQWWHNQGCHHQLASVNNEAVLWELWCVIPEILSIDRNMNICFLFYHNNNNEDETMSNIMFFLGLKASSLWVIQITLITILNKSKTFKFSFKIRLYQLSLNIMQFFRDTDPCWVFNWTFEQAFQTKYLSPFLWSAWRK